MTNIPSRGTTTIYVSTLDKTAKQCFDVITHYHDAKTLDDGVYASWHLSETSIAIVDSVRATYYTNAFDGAPGCHVSGTESH